jgi:hypothetical protein
MKASYLVLSIAITAIHALCADVASSQANTNSIAFRSPFTLKLHVDKENYYEQEFPKIPYVFKDDVYLFKDDVFGIDLQITNGAVLGVSYQSDTNKAAVSLRFTQEVKDNGDAMMLLVVENHTKHKLFIDALMTFPKREQPQRTSILPVGAGLSGYESWPEPIVQLVLRNIRLTEKPGTEPSGPANGSQPIRSETNSTPPAAGSRR